MPALLVHVPEPDRNRNPGSPKERPAQPNDPVPPDQQPIVPQRDPPLPQQPDAPIKALGRRGVERHGREPA
jgi:hypothetical protein